MKFGLSASQLSILQTLLIDPLKVRNAKVWIFGSRARGDYKPFSDIDILIELNTPLNPGFLASIVEKLEESRLPFKVDLVNINDLASSYRENILKERVEI